MAETMKAFDNFNFLALDLIKNIGEIESYYDSLSPFLKARLKLAALITRLQVRNHVLAELVYLKGSVYLRSLSEDLDQYQAKRGRKAIDRSDF